MRTNQKSGPAEKEFRAGIEKLRQDLNKEFDEKIKEFSNRNLKIQVLSIVLTAILTFVVIFSVQYYFYERNAIITSAYNFKDGEVILTIHNDAEFHSPSNIKIYGKVGEREVLLKESTNHILSKDNDLYISIPVKNTTVKIPVTQIPPDEGGLLGGVAIPSAEINKILESNHLAYKIDCDKCSENDKWRVISIKDIRQCLIIENVEGQLYFEVEAELYSWK